MGKTAWSVPGRTVAVTVLVVGATGRTGGEVLRQLRAGGGDVRAATRSLGAAAAFQRQGVDVAIADLGDPLTLPAALDGVEALFIASPLTPELAFHEANAARAADRAGVQAIVQLSVLGAGTDAPFLGGRIHHDAEKAVGDVGVPYTVLRPNGYMQNTFAWKTQITTGTIRGPIMDSAWSTIDIRDVAAVAVSTLLDPGEHAGRIYTLTGPDSLAPRQEIGVLSDLLDRSLLVEDVPIVAATAAMSDAGVPPWTVERMGEVFKLYEDGLAEEVTSDVEDVTGRPPYSFEQFAVDHLHAFRG